MNAGLRFVHPAAALLYYIGAVASLFVFKQPLYLLAAVVSGLLLIALQGGLSSRLRTLRFFLLVAFATALINPLISHRGSHILFYWLDQPFTLESFAYGALSAVSLFAVMIWFLSVQHVFTSDKIMHLFGAVSPKGALLLAMALRSLPLLARRFGQIAAVQRTKGVNPLEGSLRKRARDGMAFVQLMLTWTLEEGLQTADSMKARGYGSGPRTQFWPYRWRLRDGLFTAAFAAAGALCAVGWAMGRTRYEVYPTLPATVMPQGAELIFWAGYAAYLCMPLAMEGRDRLRWRRLR